MGEAELCSCTTSGRVLALALCLGLASCAADAGVDAGAEADGSVPLGFTVVLDSERSDPGEFQLSEQDDDVRIVTGPAGIAYHEQDAVLSGDFHVAATFVQHGAPLGYREAYGIFVGGRELDGPELEYTYLLVRPTGDFLIKRRVADLTEVIVDWSAHSAVDQVRAEGDEPRNTLAVEVAAGEARFLVNGELVHAMPAAAARPYGIAGLRANHRLDVRVSDWSLESPPPTS